MPVTAAKSELYLQVTAIDTRQTHGPVDHGAGVGTHSFTLNHRQRQMK